MGDIYLDKSFAFAVKIVELSDKLAADKREVCSFQKNTRQWHKHRSFY